MADSQTSSHPEPAKLPLSADGLRAAFSKMLGRTPGQKPEATEAAGSVAMPESILCELCPRSIVEAMLFVGRPGGKPWTARELAAAMRNVSPGEVVSAIDQLNESYQQDVAPYSIVESAGGYELRLKSEYAESRKLLLGKTRETQLSQIAIEVLSVVAYHQPISLAGINSLRRKQTGNVLAALVRKKLLRVERPSDLPGDTLYVTTERFLQVFGIESLDELPRAEELDAA